MLNIPVRLAAICGVGSPLIVLITLLISISRHSWFRWKKHSLSDLGAKGIKRNYLLNFGLVILGIVFFLFTTRANLLVQHKAGGIAVRLLPLLALGPILVALFPYDKRGIQPLKHLLACFMPYIAVVLVMVLVTIDYWQSGEVTRGIITLLSLLTCFIFALLPLLYNIGYFKKVAIVKFPSQSVPEVISAVILSFWMIMFASGLFFVAR